MRWTRPSTTGLILAGGRGARMGGVDKGLVAFEGRPLVAHAIDRFAPQVATIAISANRHLDEYARFGVPAWPDIDEDGVATFAGPLAAFATGFAHLDTDWLACAPCDSPRLPIDLVARLGTAVEAAGERCPAAVPCTIEDGPAGPMLRRHGVFALLHRSLAESLARYRAAGHRRVEPWLLEQGIVDVVFDDREGFANINTPDELRALARPD